MLMSTEYIKAKLLGTELLDYFISHDAKHVNLNISLEASSVTVRVWARMENLPKDFLSIMQDLKQPRRYEVEDYYEELLGIRPDIFDVDIVSAMIDEASYERFADEVEVKLVRHLW